MVLVEWYLFGGICVNIGCMLIKVLVVSVEVVYLVWCGVDYGV